MDNAQYNIFKLSMLPLNYYINDSTFDSFFPEKIQKISKVHWTPLEIAKKAATFLAQEPGSKILDIGSGIGKFCITAAHFFPDSEFHGIEQRKDLFDLSVKAQQRSKLDNIEFIHGDFTQLDLRSYDGIYFYNAFAENIIVSGRIDDTISCDPSLYDYYTNFLRKALANKTIGTKLTTYHGFEQEVPLCYEMVDKDPQRPLKMWIKQ